jgi:hypothetical protein
MYLAGCLPYAYAFEGEFLCRDAVIPPHAVNAVRVAVASALRAAKFVSSVMIMFAKSTTKMHPAL